nr:hypothetical protein [Tanacetum cinerariifolium]
MGFYMKNKENERMILDSSQNGPLVWPTITEEDGTTRKKTYAELSASEKDRVKFFMQGTKLSLQEKECLAVLVFNQGDDPIACLNKAMAFLTAIASSRNAAWCKKKAMLAEAQEAGQILDEEQLAFLADPSILDGQTAQTTILNTAAFQTEDLNAYDSKCDDVSIAKVVSMAYLSNYGLDVISK